MCLVWWDLLHGMKHNTCTLLSLCVVTVKCFLMQKYFNITYMVVIVLPTFLILKVFSIFTAARHIVTIIL